MFLLLPLYFLGSASGESINDVLVYHPLLMPSHATFMAKIVNTLVDANYSVVVLVNRHRDDFPHGCERAKEIIEVPPAEGVLDGLAPEGCWNVKETPMSQWQAMNHLTVAHGKQCRALLKDMEILNQLWGRKFRFLVHEVFDMCGLVLKKVFDIDQHIIVSSTRQMDTVGYELGLTNPLFHAGILSDYGSTLGWSDISRNAWFVDAFLKFTDLQVDFYKQELSVLGVPFPVRRISRSASAVFLNTHPITDSWRPSLRAVYDIGGIALHKPQPLEKKFEASIKKWKKVVLVSFGTVVPSMHMPDQWKTNLIVVIESFPDTLFLWKYERTDEIASMNITNLILEPFFPQNDLLHTGMVNLFITHGGQNSILEAVSAGVQLLVIPQFGDQFRNAQAVKERNLGKILPKKDLGDYRSLRNAVQDSLKKKRTQVKVSHLINPDRAAETFIVKMEEALQSRLTFEDGPNVVDILQLIANIWLSLYFLAGFIVFISTYKLYPLYRMVVVNIWKLVFAKDEDFKDE